MTDIIDPDGELTEEQANQFLEQVAAGAHSYVSAEAPNEFFIRYEFETESAAQFFFNIIKEHGRRRSILIGGKLRDTRVTLFRPAAEANQQFINECLRRTKIKIFA